MFLFIRPSTGVTRIWTDIKHLFVCKFTIIKNLFMLFCLIKLWLQLHSCLKLHTYNKIKNTWTTQITNIKKPSTVILKKKFTNEILLFILARKVLRAITLFRYYNYFYWFILKMLDWLWKGEVWYKFFVLEVYSIVNIFTIM